MIHQTILTRLLASSALLLLCALCGERRPNPEEVPISARFDPDTQSYAFVLPQVEPVEGAGGVRARDCGICHRTIYEEWKQSTHASSLHDIQFQSELTKDDSPKWICLNCHIPIQNQRSDIITHLQNGDIFKPISRPNPEFDYEMQQEGITCATCHVRPEGPEGASIIIGPNGSEAAPHPVRKDRAFLHDMCARCHNPRGEGLTPNLICWFYTYRELAGSTEEAGVNSATGANCIDCHMPGAVRHVADDYTQLQKREVNRHHWTGSGVPKWYEGYENLLERGYAPGVSVHTAVPEIIDDSLSIHITLRNTGAGHHVPTGDPERFILTVVAMKDDAGRVVAESSYRIGQDWEWNPARKLGENRLADGESVEWRPVLPFPVGRESHKLEITAYHVRLNSATAHHIREATGIDTTLFPNGDHYVSQLEDYYPLATFIHQEEIDLETGEKWIADMNKLIELSRGERGKPLGDRAY